MSIDVMEECRRLLLHKVQQYDPDAHNADGIIAFIAANVPLEDIRYASDQQIRTLFDQASAMLQLQPPQWSPSSGQGIGLQFPQSQPQLYPINSNQIRQPPLPLLHGQLQFGPSGSFGNQTAFPGSSGSFGGSQTPFGSPHPGPQFYPNSTFSGHQASFRPTGPSGGFQSSLPGFSGSRGHLQPQNILGDGMQSNNRKTHRSVTGYPPSSSNAQNKPCIDHFSCCGCKKGGDCGFSHESDMKEGPLHAVVETLLKLDSKIKDLCLQNSPTLIPIERLPQVFYEKYGEQLLVPEFQPDSLKNLLMLLKNIKAIERGGQHYVVLVADACGVGKVVDDSELAFAPPSSCPSKIYIRWYPNHRFSVEDIKNHFSKYGPVRDVEIPGPRSFGFVTFVYPETIKLVLQTNRHYIRGHRLDVDSYKEKHELQELAKRDAHSNSRAHMASDVNVTHEHQSHDTVESSNEKSAAEDTVFDD